MLSLLLIFAVMAMASAKAPLMALGDSRGNQVWSDFGSVARYEISIYEANIPSARWKIVGHHAQGNWDKLKTTIHAFRDDTEKNYALAKPDNFTQIWNDQGDTTWQKGSLWSIDCPTGYVALGNVAYASNSVTTLPKEMFDKVRCVDSNLTEDCSGWGVKIWDNDNSIARKDASVWPSNPGPNGFSEFFFTSTKFNERPSGTPKCLKKESFTII